MRKCFVQTAAAMTLASALPFPALAAPKKDLDCGIHHNVCYRGCGPIGSASDLGEGCRRSCDLDLWKCQEKEAKGGAKENRPKGGTGPKGGGVAKDPALPGPSNGPPKSGTWHGPVSRPKSGSVWHGPASPPKSGPVWNGPATPPKGIDGSGPILKSGGAKG